MSLLFCKTFLNYFSVLFFWAILCIPIPLIGKSALKSQHDDSYYSELISIFSDLDFIGKLKILGNLKSDEFPEFIEKLPAEQIASLFPYSSLDQKYLFFIMCDTSKQKDLCNVLPNTELSKMFEAFTFKGKLLVVSHLNEVKRNNLFMIVSPEETYSFLAELSQVNKKLSDKIRSSFPPSLASNMTAIDNAIEFGKIANQPEDAGKLKKTVGFLIRRGFDFTESVQDDWNTFLKKCKEQDCERCPQKRCVVPEELKKGWHPRSLLSLGIDTVLLGMYRGGIASVNGGLQEAAEAVFDESTSEWVQFFAKAFLKGISPSVLKRLLSLKGPSFSNLSFRAENGIYQCPPLATILKALCPDISYQSGFTNGFNVLTQEGLKKLVIKVKKGKKLTLFEEALYQYVSQRLAFSIKESIHVMKLMSLKTPQDIRSYYLPIIEEAKKKAAEYRIKLEIEWNQAQKEWEILKENDNDLTVDKWYRMESLKYHPDHKERIIEIDNVAYEKFTNLNRKKELFLMKKDEFHQEIWELHGHYVYSLSRNLENEIRERRSIKDIWWTDPNRRLIESFVDLDYSKIEGWETLGSCLGGEPNKPEEIRRMNLPTPFSRLMLPAPPLPS